MAIALGFSRELSTLAYLMTGTRITLGKVGEYYAKILLEAHGHLADLDHQRGQGDLRVVCPSGTVLRVEVKASRLSKRQYFEFCLKKYNGKTMKTDCSGADAILLLGVKPSGRVEIYVVPQPAAANVKVIKVPSKLSPSKSIWHQYRQHVGNINFKEIEELNRELLGSGNPVNADYPTFRRGLVGGEGVA